MIAWVERALIAVFLSGLMASVQTAACGASIKDLDDVNNPADDVALSRCRKEGRAVLDGGRPEDAFAVYDACKTDAGLGGAK